MGGEKKRSEPLTGSGDGDDCPAQLTERDQLMFVVGAQHEEISNDRSMGIAVGLSHVPLWICRIEADSRQVEGWCRE